MLRRLDLRGITGDLTPHLPRPEVDGEEPTAVVREILAEVRSGGDAALRALTLRLDGVELEDLRVPSEEIAAALERTDPTVREALQLAADRIAAYHRTQLRETVTYSDGGATIRSFEVPVDRVGCYVPGGRAAYPSTLLMTAIPARVAGVASVVVVVPPDRMTGKVVDVTLAAAAIAGVDEVYAVGGAQAIAALAYGTESIAPVDVICGPGNKYVAIAKREVAGSVGIAAAFAGPSEIVVVADGSVDPDLVAIDIIVQAEHGPDGLAWLVTWDEAVVGSVDESIEQLLERAPRRDEIESTLASAGYAVLVESPERAVDVANGIAPEHLQLLMSNPWPVLPRVRNAGATFVGQWSPASVGDYIAGPSHVLPTHGTARFSSALTVADFVKHHHVIELSTDGLRGLGPHVVALADAEGLDAHAQSIRLRLDLLDDER